MNEKICNFYGQPDFDRRLVEYVYRHKQHYMVFRDVPAEVCLHCSMRYFDVNVLLEMEQRFFAIQNQQSTPQQTILVPVEAYTPA